MSTLSRTDHRAAAGPPSGGGLPGAIASEWTKLWSVRSVWWSLLASVLLMAATAGQLAIYVQNSNTDDDPANDQGVFAVGRIAVDAVELTQFAVIALALLVITSEYGTGTIRTTLQWIPSRGRLLLAKTTVVAGVTFGAGLLLGGLGAAVAAPVLGDWGRFDPGETLGDAFGLAGYLALIGVFTLGLGAALRGAVGTLVTVFLVLAIVPATLRLPDLGPLNTIADALPGSAGLHFLRGDDDPYPAAVGLLILAGWAVAALLAGLAVMRRRDA
ncbi:ABC transporter permease [Plantactinospora endophytica]|uniref:ABC transporter n=1 Tax=Plantactinospora endophytica TaxID=673535 RepID=A0ABQ4DWT9_9ACTN|nr:ABC transporter permease [Plantactinospora endophytica]GIG86906.1 ABC transporter [Plantactinospora endophytica]